VSAISHGSFSCLGPSTTRGVQSERSPPSVRLRWAIIERADWRPRLWPGPKSARNEEAASRGNLNLAMEMVPAVVAQLEQLVAAIEDASSTSPRLSSTRLHTIRETTVTKILLAEDDPISRAVLERTLRQWNHEVMVAEDGAAAWKLMQQKDAPMLMLLDWMMPEVDGIELCRRIRSHPDLTLTYVILLTAKHQKEDIVHGLKSGAHDYITKPFDRGELKARIQVGERVLNLQNELAKRVAELEAALEQVHTLQSLLPICSYCKRVRDDKNYWQKVEAYLMTRTDLRLSHSICPDCYRQVVLPELTAAGIPPEELKDPPEENLK
jgi:phosphoserine phosphatase RsbU/P